MNVQKYFSEVILANFTYQTANINTIWGNIHEAHIIEKQSTLPKHHNH